jgi:hypothetical protein
MEIQQLAVAGIVVLAVIYLLSRLVRARSKNDHHCSGCSGSSKKDSGIRVRDAAN